MIKIHSLLIFIFLLCSCNQKQVAEVKIEESEPTQYYNLNELPIIKFRVDAGAKIHSMPANYEQSSWASIPTVAHTLKANDSVSINCDGVSVTAKFDGECPDGYFCSPIFVKSQNGRYDKVLLFIPEGKSSEEL